MDTLDKLPVFEEALNRNSAALVPSTIFGDLQTSTAVLGVLHCAGCGDIRKMHASLLFPTGTSLARRSISELGSHPTILCRLHCVQCDALYSLLKYPGPNGPALIVASNTHGGLSTPHTPVAVAYYLDQAYKSHAMGADSAALAMFRSALEHLLYEQGFTNGMLDTKIKALEAAITAGHAPSWARDLETEYLKVIKELGNGAIHTNGGDVTKQANIDSNLVAAVEATFSGLLHLVYEIPHMKAAKLMHMKAKAALLK